MTAARIAPFVAVAFILAIAGFWYWKNQPPYARYVKTSGITPEEVMRFKRKQIMDYTNEHQKH